MTHVNSPYLLSKIRPSEAILKASYYVDEYGVRRSYGEDLLNYLNQLERGFQQIYLRTGGKEDLILIGDETAQSTEDQAFFLSSDLEDVKRDINDIQFEADQEIEAKEFRAVSTSSNYDAVDHDFINAKSSATIYLPSNPELNDTIKVRNADGSTIKIDANGLTINDESLVKIVRKGTLLVLNYFIDDNEWVIG